LNELERKKKENKASVQELINGDLPFLMNRDLIATVREQLKEEKLIESIDDVKREMLEELASELSERTSTNSKRLEEALRESLTAIQPKSQSIIHRASFGEKSQIESLFEGIKNIDFSYYRKKISDQQNMDEEIKLIKQKLTVQSDSVEDFMDMLSALEQLQEQYAEKNQELKVTTKQWSVVQEERLKLQEEYNQMSEEIDREANQSSSVMHNATAMRALLLEFQNQQQQKGIQLIEKQALKMINRLFRKRGYLHRLVINSSTYEVTLYAEDQKRIPQSTLSAGEKQLLLMSLVWAVFDVSGNKLPFIFDTLLGRLDVEHRENLLTELIPAFGEQVLILSTDSEVTEANYKLLKPVINKEYSLNFDTADRSIKVVPSYFRFNETEKIS
ncbi:DNA sulfur modification protein DndD, partial [Exiguobacterium oxidotolerans]|uniref:DNA sulfur modification protein DndD n=1 Tax=Exiguobacterium oxidotolerans TaxID=223958 RepID=UPI001330CF9E